MFHRLKTEVDRNRSSSAIDPADTEESEQEEEREPPDPETKRKPTFEFRQLILTWYCLQNSTTCSIREKSSSGWKEIIKRALLLTDHLCPPPQENTNLWAQMAKMKEGSRERSLRRQLEHMERRYRPRAPAFLSPKVVVVRVCVHEVGSPWTHTKS